MTVQGQDQYGVLKFPARPPNDNEPITDQALYCIGSYLMAVLNSKLNGAWNVVNPNVPFVKSIQFDDPNDGSMMNEKDLPALYVWRQSMYDQQSTDDWTETTSDIAIMWIPQTATQAKRSLRAPGINGFAKTITRALGLGSDPSWIDPLDADPGSKIYGSGLMERAGLHARPYLTTTRYDSITVEKGTDIAKYPAFTTIMRISEITRWDNSWDPILSAPASPSKIDETITAGAFQVKAKIPTT